MDFRQTISAVDALQRNAKAIGAPLPNKIAAGIRRARELGDGLDAIAANDAALPTAVLAAVAEGRDPAADPDVQRAVTALTLADVGPANAVRSAIAAELRSLIVNNVDAIVATWRPVVDAASETMAAHVEILRDVDLDDATAVVRRGGAAADAWGAVRGAEATLTAVSSAWRGLRLSFGSGVPERRYFALILATAPAYVELGEALTSWQTVKAGHSLTLAGLDELQERIEEVHRLHGEANAAEAAAAQPERVSYLPPNHPAA